MRRLITLAAVALLAACALAGATSYRQWQFVYAPAMGNAQSAAARVPAAATASAPALLKDGAAPGSRDGH